MRRKAEGDKEKESTPKTRKPFHLEFKNTAQKIAWMAFEQHDILFLLGPAGVGKSHLAVAFAISELLNRKKKKMMLTRPIVEAGEKLGYLPGTFEEKINPYLMPVFDVMDRMVGKESAERERINKSMEIAPMAYLRGRSVTLDTNLITPTGFKKMGDIKIGDLVCGSDGQKTKVVGVYPQGEISVYRVRFTDGTFVDCSADHLWSTLNLNEKRHKKDYSVKSTLEIKNTLKNTFDKKNHRLPISQAVNFVESKIPIDLIY